MKKIILFAIAIFSLSIVIVSCGKNSVLTAGSVEPSVNTLTFIAFENLTDSGSVINVSVSKTGYTAVIQQNYLKDSSAIDSIKIRYEDVTKTIPDTTLANPTYNTLVDSLILINPTTAAITSVSAYPHLVSKYFTFSIGDSATINDSALISGYTYTVIASVYTANGNSQTATFSSLFKW